VNAITVNFNSSGAGTFSGHSVTASSTSSSSQTVIGYNSSVTGPSTGTAIGGRFSASGGATNIAVQATNGSIQVQTAGEGIILKSPNGTCYKLTVNNDGSLSTTAITCP